MMAKMGAAAAVLALALSGCIGDEVASIAAPQEEMIPPSCPNPNRQLEILYPQDGACLACGNCVRVGWRVRGAVGETRAKVEAWYGHERVLLGNDMVNCTTLEWQLPDDAINEVRLRVTVHDQRGKVGTSQAAFELVDPSRGPDPKQHWGEEP